MIPQFPSRSWTHGPNDHLVNKNANCSNVLLSALYFKIKFENPVNRKTAVISYIYVAIEHDHSDTPGGYRK